MTKMKKQLIFSAFCVAMLSMGVVSCIDDESAYGGEPLPALSVVVPGDAEMPVYNFSYGAECELTPDIKYDGTGELKYEWSVGSYDNGVKGPMEFVSNEKTFRYQFPAGGRYYAHLVVSDGVVGLVQDYELSINRTFEQGFMVLSNKDGVGNLVFIKDPTREEIEEGIPVTVMENCLQRVNDNVGSEPLVGAQMITWHDWNGSTTVEVNRLMICTESRGLFLNPNTFVVVSTIDSDDVTPGFKADRLILDGTSPVAWSSSAKKHVMMDSKYMFGKEDSNWKTYDFDFISSNTYMAGLNQTTDNYFIKREPLSLHSKALDMATWESFWVSSADLRDKNNLPVLQNEEMIVAFRGEGIPTQYGTYTYPCYIISRNKSDGRLFATGISGFGAYSVGQVLECHGEIPSDASTAIPAADSYVVPSDMYHRTYYYNGNCVYVMLKNGESFTFPSVNESCLRFSSDEEVTYMGISQTRQGSQVTAEDLLVATVNKSSGRGSVYIYNMADVRTDNPNPAPKAQHLNCADRITNIMYKPRIAN